MYDYDALKELLQLDYSIMGLEFKGEGKAFDYSTLHVVKPHLVVAVTTSTEYWTTATSSFLSSRQWQVL